MKYLLLLCLFASLLHAAPQDPPGILSGTILLIKELSPHPPLP